MDQEGAAIDRQIGIAVGPIHSVARHRPHRKCRPFSLLQLGPPLIFLSTRIDFLPPNIHPSQTAKDLLPILEAKGLRQSDKAHGPERQSQ